MPFTNPNAAIGVYNTDPTTILAGCGLIAVGGNFFGFLNVGHVLSSDCPIYGVADTNIPTVTTANMFHNSYSDVQVRLASNVVVGDLLNIANTTGEFQKAPSTAKNIIYMSLENGTAGNLCWASPVGAAPAPSLLVPGTPVDTGSSNSAGSGTAYALANHVHRDVVLQTAEGRVTTNATTTSNTLVDLTGATVTITTQAGSKVLVQVSYSTSTTSVLGATTTLVLDIDGVTELGSASSFTLLASSTQGGGFTKLKTGLSAGSHTFKLKWATSASTAQCRPVSNPNSEHATIVVTEVRL